MPARGQARAARVRLGQEGAEHREGHRHHRRERPHPAGRGIPSRADARPGRGPDRGHRRPVHVASPGQGQSRCRVQGPGQGVPGPGPGPAAEAEEGRRRRGNRRLRGRTPPPVTGTDLRRARQRPSTSNGGPSSATSDDERTSTRLSWRSPGWSSTAPPNGNPSKANPPGQDTPPLIAHQAVSRRPRRAGLVQHDGPTAAAKLPEEDSKKTSQLGQHSHGQAGHPACHWAPSAGITKGVGICLQATIATTRVAPQLNLCGRDLDALDAVI